MRHTAKIRGVAKHISKWYETRNNLNAIVAIFHTFNATTARVKVANDIAHEIFWSGNFDFHNRLK